MDNMYKEIQGKTFARNIMLLEDQINTNLDSIKFEELGMDEYSIIINMLTGINMYLGTILKYHNEENEPK